MHKFTDLTGKRFDRWTVLSRAGSIGRYAAFLCRCDCGTERIIRGHHLSTGMSKSCGCLALETRSKNMKNLNSDRWGDHKKPHQRLYRIWVDMRRRCSKKSRPEYKNYGELGTTVCLEWESNFDTFYNWAISNGYSDDLTIDRIDSFGNYEPGNCRWITNEEQQRNRKHHVDIYINGELKRAWECESIAGVPADTIRLRIARGWSSDRAVSEAVHKEFSHKKRTQNESLY